MSSDKKFRLFSGTSNPQLMADVCSHLDIHAGEMYIQRFSDDEIFLQFQESIRGLDVFFLQSTSVPANDNLMELLIAIDAAKRASAKQICAVMPYFGYARQDRKSAGRTPISAKLVADLLTTAGVTRILTMDLHATQIQGFFNIPVDNIYAGPLFAKDILSSKVSQDDTIVVSPDVGGVVRARALAKTLHLDIAIVDKRRPAPNVAKVMHIIGEVEGKHCILIDDIVDTAGTICGAADALMKQGAKKVTAYATHGVLSGPAAERITASKMHELVITDSIRQPQAILDTGKVRVLSVGSLMGEAILRIYDSRSISSLYD